MTDSWLDLAVPYFVPACRDVFDTYFTAEGFRVMEVDPVGRVTYSDGYSFVELSYWLEDVPKFVPSVVIGLESQYLPAYEGAFDRIALWYAAPPDSPASQYSTWRFSNVEELQAILKRVRDELIDVYAKPLWRDRNRFSFLIELRYREAVASRATEFLRKTRAEAEVAFGAGRYAQARDLYRTIGVDNLTAVERKRFEIAVRRSGPSVPPE